MKSSNQLFCMHELPDLSLNGAGPKLLSKKKVSTPDKAWLILSSVLRDFI